MAMTVSRIFLHWNASDTFRSTVIDVPIRGYGECPDNSQYGQIVLPRLVVGSAGDSIAIALVRDGSSGWRPVDSVEYSVTLAFNRTTLAPIGTVDDNVLGSSLRFARFEGVWDGASDTVGSIRLRAALGSVDTSAIQIIRFAFRSECNGFTFGDTIRFALLDLCRSGGPRYFRTGDSIFMRPVVPNPVAGSGSVRFGTAETEHVELALYDAAGSHIATIVNAELAAGEYVVDLPAATLPSGRYVLVLKTPTWRRSQPILIRH
jgi:hypothetical protein